ncbi:MAG: rare lipoprotein [Chthoniobacter sp.]|jgi:rare lipoprotein A|nr:rare lipoprotein [Chthoniobacter sp.]
MNLLRSACFLPVLLCLFSIACAEPAAKTVSGQKGTASWYGKECSKTASGEAYNPASMTAAHRTLPFGTRVRVTNLSTNRCATVRINNRGPFRRGRIIDVSQAAARELQMMRSGTALVRLEVL